MGQEVLVYNRVGTQWKETVGGPCSEISIDNKLLMFL